MRDRAVRMLAELEGLLIADPRPLGNRIRLAFIIIGTLYPGVADLAKRTRTFVERACRLEGSRSKSFQASKSGAIYFPRRVKLRVPILACVPERRGSSLI